MLATTQQGMRAKAVKGGGQDAGRFGVRGRNEVRIIFTNSN